MAGRLRIDLAALQSNYQAYRQIDAEREVGAVVKADAYGLGVLEISRALAGVGCKTYFVATAQEGAHLRSELVEADILVFEGVAPGTLELLVANRLTPVINDALQLSLWRPHRHLPVAVHVDTGMSRLGFPVDLSPADFADFGISLLMSHFACADEIDAACNRQQIQRFHDVAAHFPGVRTSFGNSAAWLQGEAFRGDVGRPGIGLYGGRPFGGDTSTLPKAALRAANPDVVARFEAQVIQVRDVAAGESIGYGASFVADQSMRVAVLGCGYADGIPRSLSNRGALAFAGDEYPIVGRVSMDLTAVDVSACPRTPRPGDWFQCFGDEISIEQAAEWAQTISYELLTGIRPRVPRQYHWG
jgi:alanine racemase